MTKKENFSKKRSKTSILTSKFKIETRSANFGSTLNKVKISGFRGIEDEVIVTFDFPITAISGLNGSGKSTITQLSICAFNNPDQQDGEKSKGKKTRYYIRDFFPISKLDNPVRDDAKVEYSYLTEKYGENNDKEKSQQVTVTRSTKKRNWSGYKRQPKKHCFYIGFLVYLPKVEKKDFTITGGPDNHEISGKRKLSNEKEILLTMGRIIGYPYDSAEIQEIKDKTSKRSIDLVKVEKLGKSYSENNMGFGEGRTIYIVDILENAPDQSFFVIEEPETALHEEAQFRLAEYLIDVCLRKHHQIILSTHSRVIANTLPPEARKLILRSNERQCTVLDKVHSCQISAILSQQPEFLIICVEDVFAKDLLTETIRKIKKEILPMVTIHEFGDVNAVANAVNVLKQIKRNVIAVRDADTGFDKKQGIFSFPIVKENNEDETKGLPPERDVFENKMVEDYFSNKYGLNIDWLFKQNQSDHHDFALHISQKLKKTEEAVRALAIEAYLSDDNVLDKYKILVEDIESCFK